MTAKSTYAFVTMFYLTTAIGDAMNGVLYASLGGMKASSLIWIVTGLQVVASLVFIMVARRWKNRENVESILKDKEKSEVIHDKIVQNVYIKGEGIRGLYGDDDDVIAGRKDVEEQIDGN